jgi:hypothetical protein
MMAEGCRVFPGIITSIPPNDKVRVSPLGEEIP